MRYEMKTAIEKMADGLAQADGEVEQLKAQLAAQAGELVAAREALDFLARMIPADDIEFEMMKKMASTTLSAERGVQLAALIEAVGEWEKVYREYCLANDNPNANLFSASVKLFEIDKELATAYRACYPEGK